MDLSSSFSEYGARKTLGEVYIKWNAKDVFRSSVYGRLIATALEKYGYLKTFFIYGQPHHCLVCAFILLHLSSICPHLLPHAITDTIRFCYTDPDCIANRQAKIAVQHGADDL